MAVSTDSKTIALIAHITIIGWIIALVMNSNNKTEYASFYIRQTLVLNVILSFGVVPFFGRIVGLIALVFIVLSLIYALGGHKARIPLVGEYFQSWFKGL
ncbi:MAG: hypothetical protein ABF242_07310 [Flavobacteriales bacterium]